MPSGSGFFAPARKLIALANDAGSRRDWRRPFLEKVFGTDPAKAYRRAMWALFLAATALFILSNLMARLEAELKNPAPVLQGRGSNEDFLVGERGLEPPRGLTPTDS